jgi:hypothetical protein
LLPELEHEQLSNSRSSSVEDALAHALKLAADAGRFDVVSQLVHALDALRVRP